MAAIDDLFDSIDDKVPTDPPTRIKSVDVNQSLKEVSLFANGIFNDLDERKLNIIDIGNYLQRRTDLVFPEPGTTIVNFNELAGGMFVLFVMRGVTPYPVHTAVPNDQFAQLNPINGDIKFLNEFYPGEWVWALYQPVEPEGVAIRDKVVRITVETYAAMEAIRASEQAGVVYEYTVKSDETNSGSLSHYTSYNGQLTIYGRLNKGTYATYTALAADIDREDGLYKVIADDSPNGDGTESYFLSFSGVLNYVVTVTQI